MTRIITDHGLIEFLPALNAILRRAQTQRFVVAVFGKVNSGKSSLINLLLDTDLMPAGTMPPAVLPIRIASGLAPRLRVTFLDHVEELPVERIAEFATEPGNPADSKRVVVLEVLVAAKRLQEGLAFIEMPDIGPITGGAPGLAAGYLPDADLALVLVDAQSSIGREDLNLMRALSSARVRPVVIISKCDLLSAHDLERVLAQVRKTIAAQLDFTPEVMAIGSSKTWMAALNGWFEKAVSPLLVQSRADLIESVERQGKSLCKSILVTLEIEQGHAPARDGIPDRAEPILRRLDESLDVFQHRWDHEIDAMSGWEKAILDRVAADLTSTRAPFDQPGSAAGSSVAQAVIVAMASQCSLLLQEFQELRAQIQTGMAELVQQTNAGGIPVHELPKPSALPLPLAAPLDGISITTSSSRHFRKELDEIVGARLRQILEEIQPRYRYWFIATMGALRESFRMQTDPLRYRNPAGSSAGADDRLAADIDFLRNQ
jgi:GTP-binding protein EngB required for normal cell division